MIGWTSNNFINEMKEQNLYDELACYTLAHRSPYFIHQHIVDAFASQYANDKTKLITIYFALVGLYLYVEKGYTGREIQLEHIRLSNRNKEFLPFLLPENRGTFTIEDVIKKEDGIERDRAIEIWCISVWKAYEPCKSFIIDYLEKNS